MNRKVLGRGLEALISVNQNNTIEKKGLRKLPLDLIDINPDQPRVDFNEESLEELANSIRSKGIIQPIIVKQNNTNNRYLLVAGERRYRAAILTGLDTVPAIIMDIDDSEVLELAIIENIQRKDLNPIEEAEGFKKLLGLLNCTQEELSERLGLRRVTIANATRLLKLSEKIKKFIMSGQLSAGHGKVLLSIPDKFRDIYAEKCIKNGWSVRDLEKNWKQKQKQLKKTINNSTDPELNAFENELRNIFGTDVHIKYDKNKKKEKGKIEISFFSLDEFDRLLMMFKSIMHKENNQ